MMVDAVLGCDFWFRALVSAAPRQMSRTLLATDPSFLDKISAQEKRRAELILERLMPIGSKANGLRNEAYWAGTPSYNAYEDITVPTLIPSCEDDLFGTAATSRPLAEHISNARLTICPKTCISGSAMTRTLRKRSPPHPPASNVISYHAPRQATQFSAVPLGGRLLPVRFLVED